METVPGATRASARRCRRAGRGDRRVRGRAHPSAIDQPRSGAQRSRRTTGSGRLRDQFRLFEAFDTVDSWEVAERRPNVVAVRKGSGGGRSLTWSAHTDVVPVTPEQAEQWSGAGPFSGEVRDGKLWGRGASDMKGAIAAYTMATRILHDTGVRLKGDLILSQACGEESGRRDIGCNTILERGYRSDLAIFPEISNFRIYPTAKGELYFRLTVPGKSTHICNRNQVASTAAWRGTTGSECDRQYAQVSARSARTGTPVAPLAHESQR